MIWSKLNAIGGWVLDLAPRPIRKLWVGSNVWKIASVTAVATTLGIAIADRPTPPPPPVPEKPFQQDSWKRDYPRSQEPAPQREPAEPAPTAPPAPAPQQVAQPKPAVAPVVVPAPVPLPSPALKAPMQFQQPATAAEKIKPRDLGNFRVVN